jgi:hypothetical protein
MSPIQWVLAIAGIAGPVFVSAVMLRRGLRSKFPFFFNYLVFYILVSVIAIGAYLYSCAVSFHVSWILGSLMMIMEIGVIHEILVNTLKSYSALVDLARILFRWAAAFLLFTALVTALATNGQQATKLEAALNVGEHCIRLMQCGLLLFLLVFESRLGVSWRNYGVAIALGLGVYAAIDLTVSYMPWLSTQVSDLIGGCTYVGVLAFWGCSLMMREPAPKSVLESPSRLIFQRWNEALMATPLVSRKGEIAVLSPVESFLPGVERTVERVMARKMMH